MSILSRQYPCSCFSASSNTDISTLPCNLNPPSLYAFSCEPKLEIIRGHCVLFESHQAITDAKGKQSPSLASESPSVRQTLSLISSHCFQDLAAVTNRPLQIRRFLKRTWKMRVGGHNCWWRHSLSHPTQSAHSFIF